MLMQTATFRLTAALTTAALLLGSTAMSLPAWAQQPTQPFQVQPPQNGPDPNAPNQNAVDPPGRVGRLVTASGAVSYHTAGDTQWTPASMNFPVASGSSFWTEPNALAVLELSASRVSLAGGTEVDIVSLDARGLLATLTQGEVLLRPRSLESGEIWTLVTPRGTVTTSHAGRIAVIAGDTASPTIVSVLEGEATITGPGLSQTLTAGQAATITGTDPLEIAIGPAQADAFVLAQQARDRPPLPPPASLRSVPPPPGIARLPGGNELQAYGAWNNDQEYGQVWYPSVDPTWVPYRQGHWAFIAPWGWTWVDDAPWGFAPFHYGRWVELRGRWCWTPGFDRERREFYPIYAPALVAFIGFGGGGSIGWVPLGPREPYRPWYNASPGYVGALNGNRPITIINNINFVNRRVATQVPTDVMIASRPIRGIGQPIGAQTLATSLPISGLHPIQPVATTAGITPATAQNLHLTPAPTGAVHAPGPVILAHPATTTSTTVPGLRPPSPVIPGSAPIAPQVPGSQPPVGGPPQTGQQLTTPTGLPRPLPLGSQPPVGGPQLTTPTGLPRPLSPGSQTPVGGPPQTGPQLTTPTGLPRPLSPGSQPPVGGPPHTGPQFATPQGAQQPPPTAPPVVTRPTPQFTPPPPVVTRPTPQFAPQPPVVTRPAPQFVAPVQHFQQPPPPQVHAAPPPQPQPQVHAAPPPPPQPQVRAAPPPPPQPQPQVRAAPPPPPPPQVHAAPPPPAAPPPRQKRPGEP